MSLHIPSCNVKSKFLKSLPVGTVFRDPRNHYHYEIVEKKVNMTLSKAALPYIDGTKQPIDINVPDKFLKLENPNRANILSFMKQRLLELEQINDELLKKRDKSCYQQIQEILGEKLTHESETHIYSLDSGLVFPVRKQKYPSIEEALQTLEETKKEVWKCPKMLQRVMARQPSVQTKLLTILNSKVEPIEEEVQVVTIH